MVYVIGFLKAMTLKAVSLLLNVSLDTNKVIHNRYIEYHYSPSSLDRSECIGINKFAVKKGIAIKIPAANKMDRHL